MQFKSNYIFAILCNWTVLAHNLIVASHKLTHKHKHTYAHAYGRRQRRSLIHKQKQKPAKQLFLQPTPPLAAAVGAASAELHLVYFMFWFVLFAFYLCSLGEVVLNIHGFLIICN